MNQLDYLVFIGYLIGVSAYGIWVYKQKQKSEQSTTDFFLAEGALTWWAIGASLIASNISAEQFIGMSGSGFRVGLAIAAYEWIAAIALIIVAIFFMPIYLQNRIFTMPQFLKTRYNNTVALIMAVFWLFLYIFVNLTAILYLGALAINNLLDGENLQMVMVAIAIFATIITIGGMKVIGYTDVIQVLVLLIGGLATTYLALTLVSEQFGLGKDAITGLTVLMENASSHFKMMFPKPETGASQVDIDRYRELPGIAMYTIGGMWVANLNYWGCNQYITQRALGADLTTARTGILFAGFLKLLMPVIVVLPGIAAYVIHQKGGLQAEMATEGKLMADNAYSAILTFLPNGLKGLSMAALTAAIVASLAGKANSISTIFTLDIYKPYFEPGASERKLVWIGRVAIVAAMLIALVFTWNDTLGIGREGGFTFIQKYTGFVSPGVFAIFLLGMFWKRTTGAAAVVGVISGFLLSVFFNEKAPEWWGQETFLYTAYPTPTGTYEIPFLNCMGLAFWITVALMVVVSLFGPKDNPKAFEVEASMFHVGPRNTILIVALLMALSAIYVKFW